MPKQILKIDRFEGGLNDNSDPRDIADNELSGARNIMVDRVGRVRSMGGTDTHSTVQAQAVTINPGYGLFRFNHDRRGAQVANADLTGSHTGGTHSTVLTDSTKSWPVDGLIGATVTNIGDSGSSGVIDANTDNTVTVAALSGGTNQNWSTPTEQITDTKNRDFSADADWVVYNPLGLGSVSIDDGASQTYMKVSPNANEVPQGAQLPASECTTIIIGRTYRISMEIWWTDESVPDPNPAFYFSYAGTESDAFTVTDEAAGGTAYTKDIVAQDITEPLAIYHGTDETEEFGVDNVSVKLIDTYTISAFPETADNYLLSSDSDSGGIIYVYSNSNDTWEPVLTGLDNQTGGNRKDIFHIVDGDLRTCDGEFGNTNSNKWYGYIKRERWKLSSGLLATPLLYGSLDGTETYDRWCYEDQEIAAPTRGLCGNTDLGTKGTDNLGSANMMTLTDSGAFANFEDEDFVDGDDVSLGYRAVGYGSSGTNDQSVLITARTSDNALATRVFKDSGGWNDTTYYIAPPFGTGFNIHNAPVTGTTAWEAGTYEIASTFIYDNKQESLPYVMAGEIVLTAGQYPKIEVIASPPYPPRITGGRIYYRLDGTDDDWAMLVDVSLEKGHRGSLSAQYGGWFPVGAGFTSTRTLISNANNTELKKTFGGLLTYEILSGNRQDLPSLTARYKTSVVAGRRLYIGNLKIKDEDNIEKIKADAMIKSPVNRFDTFPIDNLIEASVQDGDDIIKLESYADRILQFKNNKLHVINIAQANAEFLENTYEHKGVLIPAATCKTDFGIAWVNRVGCYLYDGKTVHNLLEKDGKQVINQSTWESFTTDNSIIGYAPKNRQLIVVNNASATSPNTVDMYLFDLITRSWVKGTGESDRFVDGVAHSNFIIDWNNDLLMTHSTSGTVIKWTNASQSSTGVQLYTKDYDFGAPAVRKKIYKVYVTYKGDGSSVQCTYITDGDNDGPVYNFYKSGATGESTNASASTTPFHSSSVGTDDWIRAELRPAASIKNVFSFRLIIEGTAAADFEINDISIVYRIKSVK